MVADHGENSEVFLQNLALLNNTNTRSKALEIIGK